MNSSDFNFTHENEHFLNTSLRLNQSAVGNSSIISDEQKLTTIIVNIVFLPIVIFIGIFGNVSTLIVFTQRKQKSFSHIFIIGLAFSDLLLLIFRFIANIYSIGHVYFTESFSFVRPNSFVMSFVSNIGQTGGTLFIMTIVLERFIAVWFPIKYRQFWTVKKALMVTFVVVLLSLTTLGSAIDALVFSLNENIPTKRKISIQYEIWRYIRSRDSFSVTWLLTCRITFGIVPLLLVPILNIFIMVGIKKSAFPKSSSNEKSQQRKETEQRMTRMLLAVSVLFVILTAPYTLFVFINTMRKELESPVDVPLALYEGLKTLDILNSVVNFVLYGICDKSLRQEYLVLWRCKLKKAPPPDNQNVNSIFGYRAECNQQNEAKL